MSELKFKNIFHNISFIKLFMDVPHFKLVQHCWCQYNNVHFTRVYSEGGSTKDDIFYMYIAIRP